MSDPKTQPEAPDFDPNKTVAITPPDLNELSEVEADAISGGSIEQNRLRKEQLRTAQEQLE